MFNFIFVSYPLNLDYYDAHTRKCQMGGKLRQDFFNFPCRRLLKIDSYEPCSVCLSTPDFTTLQLWMQQLRVIYSRN